MRAFLLALIAVLLALICVLFGASMYVIANPSVVGWEAASPLPTLTVRAHTPASAVAVATPTIPAPRETRSDSLNKNPQGTPEGGSTPETLLGLEIPARNPFDLVARFKGVPRTFETPSVRKSYQIGDKEQFWVSRDLTAASNELVTATLVHISPHLYMWVEDGLPPNENGLRRSANAFERKIYPTIRRYLGSEPSPGIDNDPRLHILNTRFAPAGLYSNADTLPRTVNRFSNQREMFYMNVQALEPGTESYDSVLAHEFTHMVHDNQNQRGESSWITEGLGDMGMELNGYEVGHDWAFAQNPDLQLTAWDMGPNQGPHYGAAYTFLSYLRRRFGDDFIRDIVSSNKTGIASVQAALEKGGINLSFEDVFADWVVANLINDSASGARYAYRTNNLPIRPVAGYNKYPVRATDTVHQFGTDYIQLLPAGEDVSFSFDGSDAVRVIPVDPHSGNSMWWSSRTDQSDTHMTREVDLRRVAQATLKFWTWFDIEDNWDYAFVSVSQDGGVTWQPLRTKSSSTVDPVGANYGNGITCKSGIGCVKGTGEPIWVEEQIDLSPYAGKKIQLRFEYVTDEVYAGPGFAVDDISIPEIGYADDVEGGDNGWQAKGFVRLGNTLPQRFVVQAIEFGDSPRVVPIPLDSHNRGTYSTQGFGKTLERVVIAVSGATPITWEKAEYAYTVE